MQFNHLIFEKLSINKIETMHPIETQYLRVGVYDNCFKFVFQLEGHERVIIPSLNSMRECISSLCFELFTTVSCRFSPHHLNRLHSACIYSGVFSCPPHPVPIKYKSQSKGKYFIGHLKNLL